MKVVLVLCLLAFMSCQKDIMDIAKCLYESPKVKEIISDVMVAITTKDFSKLWPKIKEALPELIPVVIKCITENEVNLEKVTPILNNWNHKRHEPQITSNYEECMKDCMNRPRPNAEECHIVCSTAQFRRPDEPINPHEERPRL